MPAPPKLILERYVSEYTGYRRWRVLRIKKTREGGEYTEEQGAFATKREAEDAFPGIKEIK